MDVFDQIITENTDLEDALRQSLKLNATLLSYCYSEDYEEVDRHFKQYSDEDKPDIDGGTNFPFLDKVNELMRAFEENAGPEVADCVNLMAEDIAEMRADGEEYFEEDQDEDYN